MSNIWAKNTPVRCSASSTRVTNTPVRCFVSNTYKYEAFILASVKHLNKLLAFVQGVAWLTVDLSTKYEVLM